MVRIEPHSKVFGARWGQVILASALVTLWATPSFAQNDQPQGVKPMANSQPLRAALKSVLRDPFAGSAAPTPPPVTPPERPLSLIAAEAAVAAPLAVAVPVPPAHELQLIGRVRMGEQTQVLAQTQGRFWVLKIGLELPSGYVVESIGEKEVLLRHAALAYPTRWPLPAQPTFETR